MPGRSVKDTALVPPLRRLGQSAAAYSPPKSPRSRRTPASGTRALKAVRSSSEVWLPIRVRLSETGRNPNKAGAGGRHTPRPRPHPAAANPGSLPGGTARVQPACASTSQPPQRRAVTDPAFRIHAAPFRNPRPHLPGLGRLGPHPGGVSRE